MERKKYLKKTPLKRGGSSLRRSAIKKRVKSLEEKAEEQYEAEKMNTFWVYCWENLPRMSEVSGKRLSESKLCFHHCWEKSPHPELKYCISNILCVTGDEHACLNGDSNYFQEAIDKKLYVVEHWEECILESKAWEDEYNRIKRR